MDERVHVQKHEIGNKKTKWLPGCATHQPHGHGHWPGNPEAKKHAPEINVYISAHPIPASLRHINRWLEKGK